MTLRSGFLFGVSLAVIAYIFGTIFAFSLTRQVSSLLFNERLSIVLLLFLIIAFVSGLFRRKLTLPAVALGLYLSGYIFAFFVLA